MTHIAIIGAGSWGTALASSLAHLGHQVMLWAYEAEVVESIRARHENELFMPSFKLPETIAATSDMGEALVGAEIVLTPNSCEIDEYRVDQFKTRAYENMIGMAMARSASGGTGVGPGAKRYFFCISKSSTIFLDNTPACLLQCKKTRYR